MLPSWNRLLLTKIDGKKKEKRVWVWVCSGLPTVEPLYYEVYKNLKKCPRCRGKLSRRLLPLVHVEPSCATTSCKRSSIQNTKPFSWNHSYVTATSFCGGSFIIFHCLQALASDRPTWDPPFVRYMCYAAQRIGGTFSERRNYTYRNLDNANNKFSYKRFIKTSTQKRYLLVPFS